jgi:hypothetical protein
MPAGRTTTIRIGLVALTAALAVFLSATPALGAKAKGKGKRAGSLDVSVAVNAPIPDANPDPPAPGATGAFGVLTSTIDAGKQFKGLKVRDVNVTAQTLGTSGSTPADDLAARLTAPNGATVELFASLFGTFNPMTFMPNPNPSIGPLTLDDESPLSIGAGVPNNATELFVPWAGSAEPQGRPLAVMDNGPVRGTWTLALLDIGNTETSNLVSWRLQVTAGRPFLTK